MNNKRTHNFRLCLKLLVIFPSYQCTEPVDHCAAFGYFCQDESREEPEGGCLFFMDQMASWQVKRYISVILIGLESDKPRSHCTHGLKLTETELPLASTTNRECFVQSNVTRIYFRNKKSFTHIMLRNEMNDIVTSDLFTPCGRTTVGEAQLRTRQPQWETTVKAQKPEARVDTNN